MATYLPGVTDSGFNPISYTPNFPYMINALQKAQAKYDANYNEIASSYDKVANSLLLVPENNQYRNQFLENTKEQLKQLSSKDLSLRQNVDEAERLFAPLWEDEDLLADYKISKQYQSQIAEYNRLKNSDKKEDRDRAWDYGRAYVELTAKDLSIAKRGDGSIQNVKLRPYVPYVNVSEEISKELKDRGYDPGIVSYDYKDGYVYEIKNGNGTRQVYKKVITDILNNRPDLQDIFKVQGVTNFQNQVYNYRKEKPNASYDEAVSAVKTNYADANIKYYDTQISNYNNIVNGNNENPGLKKELEKEKAQLLDDIGNGIIKPNDERINNYNQKYNKLQEINSLLEQYTQAKNNLNSEDFKNANGEDYFTNDTKNRFVSDFAETRELAYSQKIVFDQTFIAAQRLNESWNANERKFQNDALVDINGNGIIDAGDYRLGNQATIRTSLGQAATTKKENATVDYNVPQVSGVYNKPGGLTNSYVANLEDTKNTYASNYINYSTKLIQSNPFLNEKVPGISTYIEYLDHFINGGTPDQKYFSKSKLDEVYKTLKENKILPDNITGINVSPMLQLNTLVDFSEKNLKENNKGVLSEDFIRNRVLFEDSARKFLQTKKIFDDFNEYNSTIAPGQEFQSILVKNGKSKTYRKINANDIQNVTLIDYSVNRRITEKLPNYVANAWLNGSIPVEKGVSSRKPGILYNYENGSYIYVDPKTNKRWDLSELVNKFGTPDVISEKIKKYNSNSSESLLKFITSNKDKYGEDFNPEDVIMSRKIAFINNDQATNDPASLIFQDVLSENSGNVKEGGGIIPANYDQIKTQMKNYLGASSDDSSLNETLNLLFKNEAVRNASLDRVEIANVGRNENKSVAIVHVNPDKFEKAISGLFNDTKASGYKKAIQAIAANPIEFDLDKTTFKKYATDDYMSSIVSESMLKDGIKNSDWEKNNLYYTYSINKGANNTIVLTMNTSSYDIPTKQFIPNPSVSQTFPSEIGLSEVLNITRRYGLENAMAINNYLMQQSSKSDYKNNPYIKRPNETAEEYELRMTPLLSFLQNKN